MHVSSQGKEVSLSIDTVDRLTLIKIRWCLPLIRYPGGLFTVALILGVKLLHEQFSPLAQDQWSFTDVNEC